MLQRNNNKCCKNNNKCCKNNNNQIMTINESFLLSHCCRIRYLCFQWKENKKKKQTRKAITTLLNIMTTKYALAFGFQLPEIRYSCLFLLPNHIYRLYGH